MPVMKKCTTLNGVNLKPGHFETFSPLKNDYINF